MNKKIIQISQCATTYSIENNNHAPIIRTIALCNDGTAYHLKKGRYDLFYWSQLPEIKDEETETN